MFGPRLTRIFANRWNALWWAATILLLAWQVVPSPDDDDQQGSPGQAQAQSQDGSNPWAMATPSGEAH